MTRLFAAVESDLREAEAAFDSAPSWQAYGRCWDLDCELRALYADERPRFVCSWEAADNPTNGLTERAMRDYYKTHSVAGDARFALRGGTDTPADLITAWQALAAAVEAAGKETPTHRATRDALRTATRCYLGGYAYTVPVAAAVLPTKARRPIKAAAACCPHCGGNLASAAA